MSINFWNKRAAKYDLAFSGSYRSTFETDLSFLVQEMTLGGCVLDLGCGTGKYAIEISGKCERVVGVDYSKTMIELANKNLQESSVTNVRFVTADIDELLQTGERYDEAMLLNLLHLVPDVDDLLAKLRLLLHENGRVIFRVPCLGEMGILKKTFVRLASQVCIAPAINSFSHAEAVGLVRDFFDLDHTCWDSESKTVWIIARHAKVRTQV